MYASGTRDRAYPPKGWGQIFRMPPSTPQGRDACAYAYVSSYACICLHTLAHVCTCMRMYTFLHMHALDAAAYVCPCIHVYAYACIWMHICNS